MDLLELQQRANVLVNKVNEYEDALDKTSIDENTTLNNHTYADIFCLRPVLKLLFGNTLDDKLSRTTVNDKYLMLFSSAAPAWNTTFNMFSMQVDRRTHEFYQAIDIWNSYNMLQLDAQQRTIIDRDDAIEQGINFSYSANIYDALITESQVANVFNWNTTSDIQIANNALTFNRQVPGIVLYYLGNDYNGVYTATIPYTPINNNINKVNYKTPPLYGAYYDNSDSEASQVGLEMGAESCRIFIPGCNFFSGKVISPQQIWQPDKRFGDDNLGVGYNWQGGAVYHELVFKGKRSGASDNNLDFKEEIAGISDNDPQGLATRLVLAQMKDYYYNRPWFTELNELYDKSMENTRNLADAMTTEDSDTTFYTSFKLDYDTWAEAINKK